MDKEQVLTKEEFLILNSIRFSKFEWDPLDINIAKMQMDISKKVKSIIAGQEQPCVFQEQFLSKDPTKQIGLITIDCSINKNTQCDLVLTVYNKEKMSEESTCLFHGNIADLSDYLSGSSFLGICKGHIMWFDYVLQKK